MLGKRSPTEEGRKQWMDCFASLSNDDNSSFASEAPKAVGTWHSILAEVPEQFKHIPKAKK